MSTAQVSQPQPEPRPMEGIGFLNARFNNVHHQERGILDSI